MSRIMKSLHPIAAAAVMSTMLIGCANDELLSTQSMASKNQTDIQQAIAAAAEAKALAEEAKSIAASAQSSAANAQSVADQAMNMSRSTDERINRMFKRSMLK